MKVYAVAHNIVSPLGFDTDQNFNSALSGKSGVSYLEEPSIFHESFFGAQIDDDRRSFRSDDFTRLENLCIESVSSVLKQVAELDLSRTILIVSTTKGNIDLLDTEKHRQFDEGRVELPAMAQALSEYFNLPHKPVVISNACISGVSAILTAQKLIRIGHYDHAIVMGCDLLSEFTVSGFQSLMAIADEPCKPYDKARKGINLGEACGTILISNNKDLGTAEVEIRGGAQSNDANHISGPSRTGEGLKIAVEKALSVAGIKCDDIDYINAHGTATLYNDEMESIAFDRVGLTSVPLNSLKGYFGHTLGAAGVIESIMTIKQLITGDLLVSKGFENMGLSKPLNIVSKPLTLENQEYALKTVSGFGGCNAAIIFQRL